MTDIGAQFNSSPDGVGRVRRSRHVLDVDSLQQLAAGLVCAQVEADVGRVAERQQTDPGNRDVIRRAVDVQRLDDGGDE